MYIRLNVKAIDTVFILYWMLQCRHNIIDLALVYENIQEIISNLLPDNQEVIGSMGLIVMYCLPTPVVNVRTQVKFRISNVDFLGKLYIPLSLSL